MMPPGGGSYVGSLRGSVGDGHVPKGLGRCSTAPPEMLWRDCGAPHQAEIFAYKTLQEPVSGQRDLDRECELIVQRATFMPDIFVGGVVSVQAEIGAVAAEFKPPSATASCVVTTTDNRLIVGSLIAIGEGRINFQ